MNWQEFVPAIAAIIVFLVYLANKKLVNSLEQERRDDSLIITMTNKIAPIIESSNRFPLYRFIHRVDVIKLGRDKNIRRLINRAGAVTARDLFMGKKDLFSKINLLEFFKFARKTPHLFENKDEIKEDIEKFLKSKRGRIYLSGG